MKGKRLKTIGLVVLTLVLSLSLSRFPLVQKAFSAVKYTLDSGDIITDITSTGVFTIGTAAIDSFLRLYPRSSAPSTVKGAVYMDDSANVVKFFNGTQWKEMMEAEAAGPSSCPSGMLLIPPSYQDGIYANFCVDKYEAKNVDGTATSQAAGTPWVSITQYNARAECIRAGKHLITEQEWLAIAHNVEDVGWNWNGGVAGTNQMSDGHSDGTPGNSLAADVTGDADDDPCVGTGQSCDTSTWNTQRRTYKLSTGEYIWDFGGNVWEWVDQVNEDDYPVYNSPAAGWVACSTSGDGICGNTRTTNDQWYRGASVLTRGFLRGGYWDNGTDNGAFCLPLSNARGTSGTSIGFRCAR